MKQAVIKDGVVVSVIENETLVNFGTGFLTVELGEKDIAFSGCTYDAERGFIAAQNAPPTKAELQAYANSKQWALATGGIELALGGSTLRFATDAVSQTLITGKAARLSQPNPPASINWQTPDGSWVTITDAEFMTVAIAIADFVQATFDTLKDVLTAIDAGTITDKAGVDAASWPSNG